LKLTEKILMIISFSILSVFFRNISEPYFGAYIDKIGIYLTSYFLGVFWALLSSVIIILIYLIGYGELLVLFRLPTYLILAFISGVTIDIVMGRRSPKSGLIEISWFLTMMFIGFSLGLIYYNYSLIIYGLFIAISLVFVVSYWGKAEFISNFLRSRISIEALLVLTPLTYMLTEFSFYGGFMFNFFKQDVIPYTDVYRACLAYGGDGLLSLIIFALIIASYGSIKNIELFRKASISRIKYTSILLIIMLLLLIPTSINYTSREKALISILPQKTDPWELTIVKMDYVWLPIGAHGTNYYYLVPRERGNADSKYYQAWFGIYWVNGKWYSDNDISLVKDYIYKFAIIDQNFWLSQHGDKNPFTAVKEEESFERYSVDGVRGWLMIGSMFTHSDVASENYRDISIKGFFFVAYFPKLDKTAIVYACTLEEYYDNNFNGIRDELFKLLNSIRFSKLAS